MNEFKGIVATGRPPSSPLPLRTKPLLPRSIPRLGGVAFAVATKNEILNTVAEYRKQFEAILARNQALPESQRIPMECFDLDERITADLKRELQAEMDLVKRKTAFDVEKARLSGEKLRKFFLEEMESMPIEVLGVRIETSVKSFRIGKLNDEYFQTVADLEERIEAEEARRR
ncbi:wd-repeat protein [Culex quinquefasciatus]|uniref:Wd-repeat protein n=1 Tax=Culex quinquefasciatus TaxID=7176 RepID=B0XJV4_CULQU|nr:wd-repeat protein [Culex quinquefasciatus]|eukprot:XP_001869926.1 wd-repeat protein [Culex quinquefasciatus]